MREVGSGLDHSCRSQELSKEHHNNAYTESTFIIWTIQKRHIQLTGGRHVWEGLQGRSEVEDQEILD